MAAPVATQNSTIVRTITVEPIIRVLEPADVPLVEAMSDDLSVRSMAQRFFVGTPRIPAAMLRQLRGIDHVREEAVVALVGDRVVGLAQYVCTAAAAAEVAVLVTDPWQRNGIGRRLAIRLSELAAARCISRFEASVLVENLPARRMLASIWPTSRYTVDGHELQYVMPLRNPIVRACA